MSEKPRPQDANAPATPDPDPSVVPELYTGEAEALARHPVGQQTAENRRKFERGPSQKPHPEAEPIIQVEEVSLAFDEPILENVSFQANEGETVVVVGESGTGKSTILKLLLRLLVPDKGRVRIDGRDEPHLPGVQVHKVCVCVRRV